MLFWEKGYEATTQADMVARSGISSSSLYNSFGNKAEIFKAALGRYNEFTYEIQQPIREGTKGLDDVTAFLERAENYLRSPSGPPGCMVVRTMNELGGRSDVPDVSSLTATYRSQVNEMLLKALTRAADLGEIPREGVGAKALLLVTVMMGALSVAISHPEEGASMVRNGQALVESWRVPA